MTANVSKPDLIYLHKSVDQYNNTFYHSINKKRMHTGYSVLTEKIKTNFKARKFKINDRVKITKYNNTFSKGYIKHCSREIFITDSVLKTNPWTYKIKDLNGEKIKGRFYEKELLLNIL